MRSAPLDSDLDYYDWLNEYNEPASGHTDPGVLEMEMRAARRKQPERTEQQHIVALLRSLGAAVYVLGTTRRRGDYMGTMQSPGLCDLLAFLSYEHGEKRRGAHLLAIEVKAPRGRMSPEQIEFQRQCQLADVHHIVGGLNEVIAWLIQTGRLMAEQVPHYRRPPA